MSDLKFTPGPWRYQESRDGNAWQIQHFIPSMNAWGQVGQAFGPPPSDAGNAMAFAAAPDALHVCEALKIWSDGTLRDPLALEAIIHAARKAFRKATEGNGAP